MSSRPSSATVASTSALERLRVGDVGAARRGPAGRGRAPASATSSRSASVRAASTTSAPASAKPDGDAAPDAQPGAGDDGDAIVDAEAIEDHRARSRCSARCGAPGDERQVEVGEQAGRGARTRRAPRSRSAWRWRRCRGCAPGPASMRLGVQLLEGDEAAGVAGDLHLEALALRAEASTAGRGARRP